jgi:hypothetical protein
MDASTSESFLSGSGALAPEVDTPGFRKGVERFLRERSGAAAGTGIPLDPFAPQTPPLTAVFLPGEETAKRQFEAARAAVEQGVPAVRALAWGKAGPQDSVLFTERNPDAVTFQEALLFHYYEQPFCEPLMTLLQVCADAVRALHEAGWQHGDLTAENLEVRGKAMGKWDGARIRGLSRVPSTSEKPCSPRVRGQDNARMELPSDFLRVFFEMQWAPSTVPPEFLKAEKAVRKALVRRGTPTLPGRPPPHEKDIWIWDDRSKQAIPGLRSRDKRNYYRKRDAGALLTSSLKWGWRIRRETAACLESAWRDPVDLDRKIGIGLNVEPDRFEQELKWLEPLGPVPVLVRLYHHQPETFRRYGLEAVRRLHAEGHAVTVALVQDRSAVLNPASWRRFVDWAGGGLSGFAEAVEAGHAINRVKWGFWNIPEYREFVQAFANWNDRYPQLPLMGPAGIDFEFPRVLPMLGQWPADSLAAFSHHMYVDRRGAPENTQAGYDLVRKLAMARAVARVHPACRGERVIVSEVNWPLAGTGVWSPVGSPYQSPGERTGDPSVDEETYADYLRRYLLLALCSGMADRVYWWNLAAHGFGLVDDRDSAGWRPRPGYHMFKEMVEMFRKSRFMDRTASDDGWTYHLTRGEEKIEVYTPRPDPPAG